MQKKKEATVEDFNLADEYFEERIGACCVKLLLDRGLLVDITAWVTRQMNYASCDDRLTIVFTVRLWTALQDIPQSLAYYETVRSRGHSVLWYAAWVLARAQRHGHCSAVFVLPLPTGEAEADAKKLRIEYSTNLEGNRPHVIIGLAEDFPLT